MTSLILPHLPKQTQNSKSAGIYLELLKQFDTKQRYDNPHNFVATIMDAFTTGTSHDRSVHGRVFEYVIGEVLAREGATPLYYQAEVRHVSLAIFDWFLYHPTKPVSISCKTKARDRWKQAAYEAMSLKRVYTQAENYLITIEELSAVEKKVIEAPQTIDHYVLATTPEFDNIVRNIAKREFYKAEMISPIIKGKLITG